MVLGLSSFTFGWSVGVPGSMPAHPMTEDALLDKALEAGLSCLQIGDNLPLHTFSTERLEAFHSRIARENIRLEIGARKLTYENLGQYLQLSDYFRSPLLRFVIDGEDYEPDIATVVSLIREYVPLLREKGIRLGIENHDRFKAKELASMLDRINDDHVGICLDCVNSLGAGEGIGHVSQVLAPYTLNLHIKDYRIKRLPHKMGFIVEGCPAGQGMTDVPRLMEILAPYHRCESAVLEQWVVPESSIEDTVLKERQWAERGLRYLKQQPFFKTRSYNIL